MLLLSAPPLSILPLNISLHILSSPPLNGWEDTYKGRYRLKNRECSMGNSSNQFLSGPLLHHSVYLLSTFFLWTCRTISLPFLLHWHTCSALRGTKRTKSTFAYGVWGCHYHVTYSRMIILNPAKSLKPFAFVLVSHTALDTDTRHWTPPHQCTQGTNEDKVHTMHQYIYYTCLINV